MSKSRLKLILALPRLVGMTKTNRIKFFKPKFSGAKGTNTQRSQKTPNHQNITM